jgi:hypothetical protein
VAAAERIADFAALAVGADEVAVTLPAPLGYAARVVGPVVVPTVLSRQAVLAFRLTVPTRFCNDRAIEMTGFFRVSPSRDAQVLRLRAIWRRLCAQVACLLVHFAV